MGWNGLIKKLGSCLMEVFLVWAASAGLTLSVSSFFDINVDVRKALLWIFLWSLGIFFVTMQKKWMYHILTVAFLIWMVRLWYRWEEIVENRDILSIMFLAVLIIGISVYVYKTSLVLIIMSVLYVAAMLYYDRYPDYIMIFLWFAAVLAMQATGKKGAGRTTFWMFFISLLVMVGIHGRFSRAIAADLWEYSAQVRYFQQKLNMQWEGFVRSLDNKTEINGRLDNGNPGNNEGIDLVVFLEERPQTNIYLRGFVGGEYTPDGWNMISNRVFLDCMSLWNVGNMNDVQAQLLGEYYKRMELTEEGMMKQQIILQDLNYRGEYALIPYGCTVNRQSNFWADGMLLNSGADKYVYEIYPVKLTGVWEDREEDRTDHLKLSYTQYAKQNYLDGWQELMNLRQVCAGLEDGNFYTVQNSIRDYLTKNCTYSKDLNPVPYGVDYTEFFLFTEKKGYCAHFATAATLMFRAMGYPARYVAGYVVSPGDFVKEDGNRYKAEITGNRAHAWTEVLIDGIWYPVEMTPGYTDTAMSYEEETIREEADTEPATEEEFVEEETGLQPEAERKEQEETTATNAEGQLVLVNGWKDTFLTLFKISIYILLAVAILVLRRWAILFCRRLLFQKYGNRKAVLFLVRQSVRMVRCAGYQDKGMSDLEYAGSVGLDEFVRMMQLAQKAKFSKQPITLEEKKGCLSDSRLLEMHLYENLSGWKRICWKYGWCFR